MTKLFLFNAPPRAGKDSAADYLVKKYGVTKLQMKDELYTLTACLLHMNKDEFIQMATEDVVKDTPSIMFNGQLKSPRDMLIYVSERVVKPNFSKSWFGDSVANKINKHAKPIKTLNDEKVVVMSDCGFYDEVLSIIKNCNLTADDVCLVRIHKNGCDYSKDSRNYVYFDESIIKDSIDIENNGTLEDHYKKVDEIFTKKMLCLSPKDLHS